MSAGEEYLTAGRGCAEFTEKKSRFIGYRGVGTVEEARRFIAETAGKYPGAAHNVYAYILREDNTIRFSDDGEPSGTAGKPALEILTRAGVKDVCVVVTRYFGGILLGAGGLVRAYAAAAKLALESGGLVRMVPCLRVKAELTYADYARAGSVIGKPLSEVESTDYGAEVTVTLLISPDKLGELTKTLNNMTAGRVRLTTVGELMRGEPAHG